MNILEFKRYFKIESLRFYWGFKLLPKKFDAITLFGRVFTRMSKEDLRKFLLTLSGQIIVNHEKIHMLQVKSFKLRYLSFYLLYLWWWIKGLIKFKFKGFKAYCMIPFESEAYYNQENFNYNKTNWKKFKW